jgi:hypothetical protein
MTPEILRLLHGHADRSTLTDRGRDCLVSEMVGGDAEDAYDVGLGDGETLLARELLRMVGART